MLFELERIFSTNSQPYLELLYKGIFCLGYYGMMRVGELVSGDHTLKASNVHIGQNKNKLMMVLYSSKTHDRKSRPQKLRSQKM